MGGAAWLLTACGAAGQGATSTPTLATSSAPSPVTAVACGMATAGGATAVIAGAGALTCFIDAVSTCSPATLQLRDMGVDTGTDHEFTVLGGNPCRVSDRHASYRAPHTPGASQTDVCTGAEQHGASLTLLGCGSEGDVTLPAPS